MVFSTSDHRKGWDGKLRGLPQGAETYVWTAEAVDHKGNVIRKKGVVILIR